MAAVIGALRASLSIDTAAWESGLKSVQGSLNKAANHMKTVGKNMSLYVTTPIVAAAGIAAAALSGLADEAKEVSKAAMLSNTSVEELQQHAFYTRSLGIETEKLGDIYKDTNDKIGDYFQTGGGAMADFFDNIAPKVGITQEAFANLSGPEGLQLYYNSLKQAGASHAEIVFYMEAIASDASLLIPHLENVRTGLTDVTNAAGVMTATDISALQAWNASLTQMQTALRQVLIALVSSGVIEAVANFVSSIASAVTEFAKANPEMIRWGAAIAGLAAVIGPIILAIGAFSAAIAAINPVTVVVIAAVAAVAVGVYALYKAFEAVKPYIQEWIDIIASGVQAVLSVLKSAANLYMGAMHAAVAGMIVAFNQLPGAMADIAIQAANAVISTLNSMSAQAISIVNGMINAINGAWATIGAGPAIDPISGDAMQVPEIENPYEGARDTYQQDMKSAISGAFETDYMGEAGNTISSIIAGAKSDLESLTTTAKETGQAIGPELNANAAIGAGGLGGGGGGGGGGKGGGGGLSDAARQAQQDLENLKAEGKRVFEETRTPLENYNAQLERLSTLLKGNFIDQETYNRALVQAKENFDQASDSASQLGNAGQSIGSTFSSAFKGILDGSKSVGDALKDILSQLADMAMNAAFQALLGGGSGGGKGGGGGSILGDLFGSLFGFARGGSFKVGSNNGMGGVDSQLVAFRASPNETVTVTKPNQAMGGGTYAPNIIINNNAPNTEARAETNSNGDISVMIDRVNSRNMTTPGTDSYSAMTQVYGAREQRIQR